MKIAAALAFLLAPAIARAGAAADLRAEVRGLGELIAIQARLTETELEVGRARRAEAALDDDLRRAKSLFEERRRGLLRTRAVLRMRLRALRRGGGRGFLGALLSARDLSGYRRRRRAVARAVQEDLGRLRAYVTEIAKVHALAAQVATKRERARAIREENVRRRDELALLKREQEAMLRELRRRGVAARLAHKRGRARTRLARLLRSLRAEVVRAGSVHRLRRRLPHPVDGPVVMPYGTVREPPFGTVAVHAGWQYRVEPGTRVGAVYAGRVVFARHFRGYGNMAIIDHGGKVHSLSGRLAEIRVREGDEVSAGQTLGTTGGEHSLRGPGLYFELRVRGRPVDPALWLAPRAADPLPLRAAALAPHP